MITQAGLRPSRVELGDPALHRLGVVEVHGEDVVDRRLRDAAAVGQRDRVVVVADLVVLDADRDHHRVVVAVVGAEDLQHVVAAGERAGDADRVHRRLRAGVRVAPLRQPPAAGELVADDDRVLGRRREVRAQPVALADRLADRRMRVALDHRAEAVVEVPHLVAVDVPDLRAGAALEVDRPRLAHLVAGGHAGGEVLVGAREGLAAALGRLVEALGLALGQLGDACAVDRDGLSVGGHGQPIVGVVVVPVCTSLTRADAGSYNGSRGDGAGDPGAEDVDGRPRSGAACSAGT